MVQQKKREAETNRIGMRDLPALQIKKAPQSTIDANGLKRAGGGVADLGKMSPPDLPPRRCDALTLGMLDRFGNQFSVEFERETSRKKIQG